MKKISIGISITLNILTFLCLYFIIFGPGRNYILGQIYGAENERRLALFNELEIKNNDIVMLGDSLTSQGIWTELLPGIPIINRGISGNSTIEVLSRMAPITQNAPAKVFLMIGTNDVARGYKISDTVDNILEIVTRIKESSPNTQIYVQSVLPTNSSLNGKIIELNSAIKTAIEGKADWIDLFPLFLDESGTAIATSLSNDGIHLMGDGYIVWRNALSPYVGE